MTENLDEFIEHYGIRGMKWGIRRKRKGGESGDSSPTLSKSSSSSESSDSTVTKTKSFKKGDAKKLTDKELRERINRLNMEKQYKQLISEKEKPGVLKRGASVTKQIIGNSAKQATTNFLSNVLFKDMITRTAKKAGYTPPKKKK